MKKLAVKILFAAFLLSGAGCKKWLDLQPQDGITGAEFWKTKEQVNSAVIGCYASLLASPTGSRPLAESFFFWGELRADMIYATATALPEEIDIVNVNILPTNSIANWRSVYQTINYCNTVIDHAPDVLKNDATFTQDALKKYVAEAKALRGLMYFYLVRTFGEVPLKLKSTSSDKEIEQLPKSTQQQVLTQILKDLGEAETDAIFSYGTKAADKGRITKFTIYAIQADVHLWMDNYADCITACNKIINSNQFGLIDGSSQSGWFFNLFASGNSN